MAGNGETKKEEEETQRLQHCSNLFSLSRDHQHKSKIEIKSSPSDVSFGKLKKGEMKIVTDGCGHSEDNSECFEPQSFMTLVDPECLANQKVVDESVDIETLQISNQPNSEPSAPAEMFLPTLTDTVSSKLEGNEKNQQFVIAKVIMTSSGSSPLKSLLVSDTNTADIHNERSPIDHYPVGDTWKVRLNSRSSTKRHLMHYRRKDEKNTKQGRKPSWRMPFVCCSATFVCCSRVSVS